MIKLLKKYITFEKTEDFYTKGINGTINKDLLSQLVDCQLLGYVGELDVSPLKSSVAVKDVNVLLDFTKEEVKAQNLAPNEGARKPDANNREPPQRYGDKKKTGEKTMEEKKSELIRSQQAAKGKSAPLSDFLITIINEVIKGAYVGITNIHLRIETSSGFYGIVLESLTVVSSRNKAKKSSELVCKLKGFRIYADPYSDEGKMPTEKGPLLAKMRKTLTETEHEWIFSYDTDDNNNISLEILDAPRQNEPIYKLNCIIPQISLNLTKPQYNRILASFSGGHKSNNDTTEQCVAPTDTNEPLAEEPKAIGANLNKEELKQTVILEQKNITQETKPKSNIVKSLKSDMKKLYTKMEEMASKDDAEEGESIDQKRAEAMALLQSAKKLLQADIKLNTFEITLKNEADDRDPILRAALSAFATEINYWKKGDLNVSLSVKDMDLVGMEGSKILEKKVAEKPILNFTVDKTMCLEVQPFYLTFRDNAICRIVEFFVPPYDVDVTMIASNIRECFGAYSLLAEDELVDHDVISGPGKSLLGTNLAVSLVQPTIRMYGDNGLEADIDIKSIRLDSTSMNSEKTPELVIQTGFNVNVNGVTFSLKRNPHDSSDNDDDADKIAVVVESERVVNIIEPFNMNLVIGIPVYSVRDDDKIPIFIASSVGLVKMSLDDNVLVSSMELVHPFLSRLFPLINNYIASLAENNGNGNTSNALVIEDSALPIEVRSKFDGFTLKWVDSKSKDALLESSLTDCNFACKYARSLLNGEGNVTKLSVYERFSGDPCELLSACGTKVEIKDTNQSSANVRFSFGEIASSLNVCSIAQTVGVASKLVKTFVPVLKENVLSIVLPEQEASKELAENSKPFSLDSISIPIAMNMGIQLNTLALKVFDSDASIMLCMAGLSSSLIMTDEIKASVGIGCLSAGVLPSPSAPPGYKPPQLVTLGPELPDSKEKGMELEVKFVPRDILFDVSTKISHVKANTSSLRELMGFVARTNTLFADKKDQLLELKKELQGGADVVNGECDEGDALFRKVEDFLFLTPPEKFPKVSLSASVKDVVLDFVPPFAPDVLIHITVDDVKYRSSDGSIKIAGLKLGTLNYVMTEGPLSMNVLVSPVIDREAKEFRIEVSSGISDVHFAVNPKQIPPLVYLIVGGIQSMFSTVSSDVPFPSFLKIHVKEIAIPNILVKLLVSQESRETALSIFIQRFKVTGTIFSDEQKFEIAGRRINVIPILSHKNDFVQYQWPSKEGDDTIAVCIARWVDTEAFHYGVSVNVSELTMGDFNTFCIFERLLPFVKGISLDFAKNICLPPCEKDRIPTLVDVKVNLPEIPARIQNIAEVGISPIKIGFKVNFHGAILGAELCVDISQGLSVRFPAGPDFLAVSSFSVGFAAGRDVGCTKVAVGKVRCALSPSVGSDVIGKLLNDMFEMTKSNDPKDLVIVTQECDKEAVPDDDKPASLHPILEKMKLLLTMDGATVECRRSETKPILPGPPLVTVSKITASTPMLSRLIGGAEPAQVAAESVRVSLDKESISLILDMVFPIMNCVNTHMSSSMSMLSSSVEIQQKTAVFARGDVSRLLSLLPSIKVVSNLSLVEVVWKKRFSVEVSSVAICCGVEHKESVSLSASVEKIKALDIHEETVQGFVLLDTPAGNKFVEVKGTLSEEGVKASANIESLIVMLTPGTIASFVEDSKWLARASSTLVTLSKSIAMVSSVQKKRKKKFMLPVDVTAAVGRISALVYENYSMSFAILSAEVGVESVSANVSFQDDGSPRLEAAKLALRTVTAEGKIGENAPAVVVKVGNVSSSLGPSGPVKVLCELLATVHAENIMTFVNKVTAMDFSFLNKQAESPDGGDHKEWEISDDQKRSIEDYANTSFVLEKGLKREESIESKYPTLKAISLVNTALKQKVPVVLDCSVRADLCTKDYGSFSVSLEDSEFEEIQDRGKRLKFGLEVVHTTKGGKKVVLLDKRPIEAVVGHAEPDDHLRVSVSMDDVFRVNVDKDMLKDLLSVVGVVMDENSSLPYIYVDDTKAMPKSSTQEIKVVNKCNAPKLTVENVPGVIAKNNYSLEGWGQVRNYPQLLSGSKKCLKFKKDGDPTKFLYLVLTTEDGGLVFTTESTFNVRNKIYSDLAICFCQAGSSEPNGDTLVHSRGTVIGKRSEGSAPPQFVDERDNMRIRIAIPEKGELWSEPFSMTGSKGAWALQPRFVDPSTKSEYYVTLICKKRSKSALEIANESDPSKVAPTFDCISISALIIKNALPTEISLVIYDRKKGSSSRMTIHEAETVSAFCVERRENMDLRIEITIASRYKASLKVSAEYPSLDNVANLNSIIKSGKRGSANFEDPNSQVARVLSVSFSDKKRGEDGAWVLCFGYQCRLINYLPIGFSAENELDLSTKTRHQKLIALDDDKIHLHTQNDTFPGIPTGKTSTYDLEAKTENYMVTARVLTNTRSVILSSNYRLINCTGKNLYVRQPLSERREKETVLENEGSVFLLYEKADDDGIEKGSQITLQVDGYEESFLVNLRELPDSGTTYVKVAQTGSTSRDFKFIRIVK